MGTKFDKLHNHSNTITSINQFKPKSINPRTMLVRNYFKLLHTSEGWQIAMAFRKLLEEKYPHRDVMSMNLSYGYLMHMANMAKQKLSAAIIIGIPKHINEDLEELY